MFFQRETQIQEKRIGKSDLKKQTLLKVSQTNDLLVRLGSNISTKLNFPIRN
jgi:hypothetical protein